MKISIPPTIPAVLSIVLLLSACRSDDTTSDESVETGTDTETGSADTETGSADSDTASDSGYACDGECDPMRPVYSSCTCAADDPCGWAGDGRCDDECVTGDTTDEMFDDSEDCGGCRGECDAGHYTPCTCDISDPCGWAGNGFCDAYCFAYASQTREILDDTADCGVCGGACPFNTATPCTCDPSDPCGRSNDGWCDDACITLGVVDEMFDESEDC